MSMEKFKFEGVDKRVIVYEDKVSIEGAGKDFLVRMFTYQGQKTFLYESLSSVEFKEASTLSAGYLKFNIGVDKGNTGNLSLESDWNSDNKIDFVKKHQNEEAKAIKNYVEDKMLSIRKTQQGGGGSISPADEIRKFKQLLDEGIISQIEFEEHKKQYSNYNLKDNSNLKRNSSVGVFKTSDRADFDNREKNLDNDSYKIYLAEKYKISRNELFQKYVYDQKMYDDLNDLLEIVHKLEVGDVVGVKVKESSINEMPPPISEEEQAFLEKNSALLRSLTDKGFSVSTVGSFPSMRWTITLKNGQPKRISTIEDLSIFNDSIALGDQRSDVHDVSAAVDFNTIDTKNNINKSKAISGKFPLLFLVTILIASVLYWQKPAILSTAISKLSTRNLPNNVQEFIAKKQNCDHFLNEFPYDNERKKFLRENILKYCPDTDQQLDALKKMYSNNNAVLDKLSSFSKIGILETGPELDRSYLLVRKRLFSNNWKPWKFNPINNYIGPFPEVMTCDEGYCDGYFVDRSGKLVVRLTYRDCGSDYIGACPGYNNGFLILESYETMGIDAAIKLNKIAKDHFE